MNTPTNGNGSNYALHFTHAPRRVISLVPSLTESLFDLGLGEAVVGITDYCIHPAAALAGLPRLGGTKNPRLAEIQALQPDLVLANWEENTRPVVESLREAGVPVWVTFPKSVREALDDLWEIVEVFRNKDAGVRLRTLELTLDWALSSLAGRQPVRTFCPVWHERSTAGLEWWMTFNRRTYCHDLLAILGCENVFAERQRLIPLEADLGLAPARDPGENDTRYPRVTLEEIRQAQPEIILLPDEPYGFDDAYRDELARQLADTPAAQNGRLHLVDGTLITWHGTRLARALRELPAILALP